MNDATQTPHAQDDNEFDADLIAPVAMRSQERGARPVPKRRRYRWKAIGMGAVLVAAVAVGVWVWVHLRPAPQTSPSAIAPTQAEKPSPVVEAQPPPAAEKPVNAVAVAAAKAAAEKALGDFLEIKNRLATKSADRWGQEAYAEILQFSQQADAHFMDQAFEAATEQYTTAAAKAEALAAQMPEIFLRLVAEGQSALARGESALAQEKLESALLINPEDPVAQKSYQRAQVLDDVLQLVLSGKQHEENQNHALAYADYQKATALDPEHEPAREGLARVQQRIKTDQFNALMSEGLAALHRNDLKAARARLMKAKTFEPDAPAVMDALNQLEQAEVLSRIATLRRSALAAEQAEAWDRALKDYLAVLQLDPTVHFAIQGRQRTRQNIYLLKRMDYYLDKPEALEADEQLQNALALKDEIDALGSAGPKFKEKTGRFSQLLSQAQIPVTVIIQSDDLTEVAIYRVGKLGRFVERRLDVRPGTYTVVGSRDGYQDVRHKLVVKSGQSSVQITVICEKKI